MRDYILPQPYTGDHLVEVLMKAEASEAVTAQEKQTWNDKYAKPAMGIPSTDMSESVNEKLQAAETAYQKPQDGIPSTDMDASVQTSLGKADTAIQSGDLSTVATTGSYTDLKDKPSIPDAQVQSDWNEDDNTKPSYIANKPTIPTVPTNVSEFTNDAGYLTQHQDISGKEDTIALVTAVNATDDTQPIETLTCELGKYYRIPVAVGTLTVTLPAIPASITVVKIVQLYLTGGTTPNVTISATAPSGGTAPQVYFAENYSIESGSTYEVNCLWNGEAWIVASVAIDTTTT